MTRWPFLDWDFRDVRKWEEKTLITRRNQSWGDLVEQHPKQVAASAKVPRWKCTLNDKTKACESGGVWRRCGVGHPKRKHKISAKGEGKDCWSAVSIDGRPWASLAVTLSGLDSFDICERSQAEKPKMNSRRVMEEADHTLDGEGWKRTALCLFFKAAF